MQLAGGVRGQSPPPVGPGRGDTPRLGARPSPAPGSFGVQPGPPPQPSSPGAGLASRTRSPARDPRGTPAHSARARVRAGSRARGPERAGATRAGPLGAVRAGGGAGRGAPRVPARRANGRPAFGKIAIYGHVLGPRAPPARARVPLRLNSGGGGRARSHSPQPARVPRSPAARPSRPLPPPPPVRGRPARPGRWSPHLVPRSAPRLLSGGPGHTAPDRRGRAWAGWTAGARGAQWGGGDSGGAWGGAGPQCGESRSRRRPRVGGGARRKARFRAVTPLPGSGAAGGGGPSEPGLV